MSVSPEAPIAQLVGESAQRLRPGGRALRRRAARRARARRRRRARLVALAHEQPPRAVAGAIVARAAARARPAASSAAASSSPRSCSESAVATSAGGTPRRRRSRSIRSDAPALDAALVLGEPLREARVVEQPGCLQLRDRVRDRPPARRACARAGPQLRDRAIAGRQRLVGELHGAVGFRAARVHVRRPFPPDRRRPLQRPRAHPRRLPEPAPPPAPAPPPRPRRSWPRSPSPWRGSRAGSPSRCCAPGRAARPRRRRTSPTSATMSCSIPRSRMQPSVEMPGAVLDVELGLAERRRDLVLDDLHPHAVADRLGALLERLDAADVEALGRVELERAAAGLGLRASRTSRRPSRGSGW